MTVTVYGATRYDATDSGLTAEACVTLYWCTDAAGTEHGTHPSDAVTDNLSPGDGAAVDYTKLQVSATPPDGTVTHVKVTISARYRDSGAAYKDTSFDDFSIYQEQQ